MINMLLPIGYGLINNFQSKQFLFTIEQAMYVELATFNMHYKNNH